MTEVPEGAVRRAARAGVWSSIDLLTRQALTFGVSVVLARLLTPAEFGVIALVTFFASLSIVFIQGGLAMALVQRRTSTVDEESTVFWFNLGASGLFAVLLVLASGGIARFYEQPVLQPLLAVAAAQIVLGALSAVQSALLGRELAFAGLTKVGLVATSLSGIAAIAAALAGWGVWALAMQLLVSAGLNSAGLWLISPWRPRLVFKPRALGDLLRFGSWLSLSSVLEVLYTQGFSLLLAKWHGVRDLGLYNRAISTQLLPSSTLSALITRLALPLFAERADDPEGLRRGVRLANGLSMLMNLPAMLGLAFLAPAVLRVLFGPEWVAAAPILSILALSGTLLPLHVINLQATLAQGRSDIYFRLEILKKLLGIACIIAGSYHGLLGLAWGQVAANVLALAVNAAPLGRMIGYNLARQIRDLAGLALPSMLMVGFLWTLQRVTELQDGPLLLVGTVGGAMVYLGSGLLLKVPLFLEAARIGLDLLRRRSNPLAS